MKFKYTCTAEREREREEYYFKREALKFCFVSPLKQIDNKQTAKFKSAKIYKFYNARNQVKYSQTAKKRIFTQVLFL